MTLEQYEQFRVAYAQTAYVTMTSYMRRLLLGKPVKLFYRDRAFDEFTEAALGFRKEVRLMMERSEWGEEESLWIRERLEIMEQLHIKIHEHVRKNNKNKKRPEDAAI